MDGDGGCDDVAGVIGHMAETREAAGDELVRRVVAVVERCREVEGPANDRSGDDGGRVSDDGGVNKSSELLERSKTSHGQLPAVELTPFARSSTLSMLAPPSAPPASAAIIPDAFYRPMTAQRSLHRLLCRCTLIGVDATN